ncbi:hypothetical protein K1T71_011070 [Dendrolimus kikuchii]|uniref:Uncharacterized protein n=1 Tax=Dendrolimus kikuchii TaxID=765133 RepID=A0ACC1CMP0_9NEOP|nr:hypothetical protein K1T71_011070 [Dendrolimus kikuchii]
MSFTNKVVLITGGSSGIGAKTAILFAKEGANVAIVGRNVAKLAKVEEEINQIGNKPLVIVADVSKDDEAITIVKKTVEAFGKLDILVNNAGIMRHCEIFDASFLQVYDEIMNTNMRPVVIITSQAVPYIRETKGNIINISSVAGIDVIQPGFISYQASKAALTHFTKALAVELGPYGVRANIVSPGPVKTDIFVSAGMGNLEKELENTTVLNRLSDPEEVADIIAYLASDKAKSVTGSNYVIDNGFLIK